MMIIIHTWQLERKGYATGRLLCSAMSRKQGKRRDRGNPMRRFQLPLLGSNQDSPDPEGPQ
jgi:hypothetical protein